MDEAQSDGLFPRSAGERLAEARRAHGLDLGEVAAHTRVPVRHLEAIEHSRFDELPAATYAIGFVRTYATMLGLDAAAIAQQFRTEMGGRAPVRRAYEPFEPADPARIPSKMLALVAILIALLLAGGYAIWRSGALTGDGATDRAKLAAGTSDQPAPPPARPIAAPSAAPVPQTGPVTLTATDAIWLRVTDGETKLLEKQMNAGESWAVPPTAADPRLLTGRPQVLRVTVGASVIPPLGEPEQRIKDVSLKPAALLARLAPVAPASPAASAPVSPAASGAPQGASDAALPPMPGGNAAAPPAGP